MRAKLDCVAQASMITRSKANETGYKITELAFNPQMIITDSTGTQHIPNGRIRLRYYKKSSGRSQEEDFCVVDNATHDVIFGETSPLCDKSPGHSQVFPLGFKPQSKGSYIPSHGPE